MTPLSPNNTPPTKPSCADPYRPYRPWWLHFALVSFFLVYWVFSLVIESIDPSEPVSWLIFITSRLPGLETFQIVSPIARWILHVISPRVLLHLFIPFIIGFLMAERTAGAFLRQFYNFSSTADALKFLGRLKVAAHPRQIFRPMGYLLLVVPLLIVLFFAIIVIFLTIVYFFQPGMIGLRIRYLQWTIILFVVLWLLLYLLCLSLVMDYSRRTNAGAGRWARLLANRIAAVATVTAVFIVFPLFWLATFFLFLAILAIDAWLVFWVLVLFAVIFLVTYGIIIMILPARPVPVLVTPEELDTLRREHALLRVGGPGRVFLQSLNHATITEFNGRFCRVLKPGLNDLGAYEYIHSMVDLRQQERERSREFLTKDGIQIKINVGVIFRVASNDNLLRNPVLLDTDVANINAATRPTNSNLYPYGNIAVRRAAYTKTVLKKDGSQVNSWHALPWVLTQARVRKAVQELRYDELFAPDDPDRQPHPALRRQVTQATRVTLRRFGVHLIDVRLGPITPLESVTGQHIESWQAFWKKQERITQAQGEAQVIEETALARREAERVMLQAIIEAVQQAEQEHGSDVTRSIVALRVVETLDRMARRSERFGYPAGHTLIHQLENLQAALHDEVQAGGDQNANAAPPPTINLR